MTNEAKVGAFTLAGLVLLTVILLHMGDFRLFGSKNYTLYIGFNEAVGVNPSAEVRFAGVVCGRVLEVKTEGMGAVVTVEVEPKIRIPRTSKITIASSGFLSEKFIGISPGKDTGDYLADGEYVYGVGEQTMDSILGNMNTLVEQAHAMVSSMNAVLGNKDLQRSLVDTAINMREITGHMRDMTGAMAQMAQATGPEMAGAVRNLNLMSENLVHTTGEVEKMVTNFSSDGQTGANLRMAIANLTSTSARIEKMAASLEGVVTDPQVAEDLKATLHNVRSVSQRADSMLGGLGGTGVTAGVETMYSGKASDWDTNFDLRIAPSADSFLLLGYDDIGDGSHFNAQVGKKRGAVTGRAGIMHSYPGIGVDVDAGSRWRFSAEAYDLNDVAVRAGVRYRVSDKTYLITQVKDVNDADRRATYVGLRQEF